MSGEAAPYDRVRVESGPAPIAPSARSGSEAPVRDATEWDWDDLYARLGRGLLALGQRRFGLTREDAEEALQRAATSIVHAAPVVRNPEAYLTSVFLRECSRVVRAQRHRTNHELPLFEGLDPADDSCERIEVTCRFRKAFSLLSPFCRAVMKTCLLDGMSKAAAAAAAASSTTSIYRRYRKCLRTLAHALG